MTDRFPGSRDAAAVVFDVDGVLVESPHEQAWRAAFTALMHGAWRALPAAGGYAESQFTTAVYQQHVAGKPRLEGARAVLAYFDVPDDDRRVAEYARQKQQLIEELIAAGAFKAFPDALRFALDLHGKGVHLAAASSSKNANEMMSRVDVALVTVGAEHGPGDQRPPDPPRTLLEVFDVNVCGRDVGAGKPDPGLFLLAAEELHIGPDRCIVIEDAPAGVEAAKAGGMKAIGVARLDDAALLQRAGADLVVTSLDEVAVDPLVSGRLQTAGSRTG